MQIIHEIHEIQTKLSQITTIAISMTFQLLQPFSTPQIIQKLSKIIQICGPNEPVPS